MINIVLFLWRDYDISKEQRLVKYLFLVIFQLKGADFMNTLYVDIDESTQNNQVYAMNFNQDIFNITSLTILIDVIILTVKTFVDKEKFDSIIILANLLLYTTIIFGLI